MRELHFSGASDRNQHKILNTLDILQLCCNFTGSDSQAKILVGIFFYSYHSMLFTNKIVDVEIF